MLIDDSKLKERELRKQSKKLEVKREERFFAG